jgi:hypothetical protein
MACILDYWLILKTENIEFIKNVTFAVAIMKANYLTFCAFRELGWRIACNTIFAVIVYWIRYNSEIGIQLYFVFTIIWHYLITQILYIASMTV